MLSCHSVYWSCQRNIHCWLFSSKAFRCVFRSASRAFCFLHLKRNLACASFLSSSLHSSKMNRGWCGQWVTVIHKPYLCLKLLLWKLCWGQYLLKIPFIYQYCGSHQGYNKVSAIICCFGCSGTRASHAYPAGRLQKDDHKSVSLMDRSAARPSMRIWKVFLQWQTISTNFLGFQKY